jgi:hypothetical protein
MSSPATSSYASEQPYSITYAAPHRSQVYARRSSSFQIRPNAAICCAGSLREALLDQA